MGQQQLRGIAVVDVGYTNTKMTLENIGKAYMGREISGVMGVEGAEWLDRAERAKWAEVVKAARISID